MAELARQLLNRLGNRVRLLHPHSRWLRNLRWEGHPRRVAGGVEEGSKKDEGEQRQEAEPDRVVEEGDHRHAHFAEQIGGDAHPAAADAIDHRTSKKGPERGWQEGCGRDKPRPRGAPVRLKDEPRDRPPGELVADLGDGLPPSSA